MTDEMDRRAVFAGIAAASGIIGVTTAANAEISQPSPSPDVAGPVNAPQAVSAAPVTIPDGDPDPFNGNQSAASPEERNG